MEYYIKDVGLRIKNLRRQKNMTQMQLAEKLCYATERQVQRIENGEAICPVERLVDLAEILNTSTDYILLGKNQTERREEEKGISSSFLEGIVLVILEES